MINDFTKFGVQIWYPRCIRTTSII